MKRINELPANNLPTVQSVWTKTIEHDLRQQGRNVERVLEEAGLAQRTINREGGRIPWLAQSSLMEIAARELADDCYGLHLAATVDVRDADVLAYLGLASRTLGDALANLARYVRVFTEMGGLDLSAGDDEVTVNLIPVMENFAGTGAGFAVNWNISGNPSLDTTIKPLDYNNDPLPTGAIYNTGNFSVEDNSVSGKTYKASPFSDTWMYAIDYNVNGGKDTNDNYLIFDVTKSTGVLIADFIASNNFMFAVDIFGGPCNPTCVVAAKVPEPATWLMFFAGLAGLTYLLRRRRVFARAA